VINSPPTRQPPDHNDIVLTDIVHIDFLDRVLVASDDNGRLIDVEKQYFFFWSNIPDQVLFNGKVDSGIFIGFVFNKQHVFS